MKFRQRLLFVTAFVVLAGLSLGALNPQPADFSVELTWQGSADLDLVVTTPSGYRISYANQAADGGTLEADTNGYCVRPPAGSAPGEYYVTINYALPCGEDGNPVQWHLTVRSGEEVTERSGEVVLGQSLPIGRFLRS